MLYSICCGGCTNWPSQPLLMAIAPRKFLAGIILHVKLRLQWKVLLQTSSLVFTRPHYVQECVVCRHSKRLWRCLGLRALWEAMTRATWAPNQQAGDDSNVSHMSLCYVQLRDQFLGGVVHKCDIVCMQGFFARKWSEICRHPGPPCNKHVTFLVVTLLHFHAVQVACLLTCFSGIHISEHTLGFLVTHAASQLLSDMLVTMSYTVCSHRSE